MNERRFNPDDLLKRVEELEARKRQGKLKIFFGFAPGVGKTYAMLEEAHRRKAEGADVVVGFVETHGRRETETLLEGLEVLPLAEARREGVALREFDLDAALKRRPALILVDELPHTNAPGSRHQKRWQDVEELLGQGIGVYSTLNVQHIESLIDVVAQITVVTVRETVPDSIFERADELELVDIPPEELLDRLREGKVYVPDLAQLSIENFFRKGNLIALRELSLRKTAQRVDAQMQAYRRDRAIRETWPAGERLLVCVGPSPFSSRLTRGTKRMAESLHAEWIALSVETPAYESLPRTARDRVVQTLRLAAQLGARTATISAPAASDAILAFARDHNVTKIVVGKPLRRGLRERIWGSVVDELIWKCGDIDIYVITGETDEPRPLDVAKAREPRRSGFRYAWSVAAVFLCTAIAWLASRWFAEANLIMIYLAGVTLVAARHGRGPSMLASCLGVAAFDFFFVQPHLTFAVADAQYVVTFAIMLAVGLLIGDLTARLRYQADAARKSERRTADLYEVSRGLASASSIEGALEAAARHIGKAFDGKSAILLPDGNGRLKPATMGAGEPAMDSREASVAAWVFDHGEPAGQGTATLPEAGGLHLPLRSGQKTWGTLWLRPHSREAVMDPERLERLEAFCGQIALALEREHLTNEARAAQVEVEAERARNVLLSSVSHDLRTPLAAITGSASALVEAEGSLAPESRLELIENIYDESRRLDRVFNNILQMSRLEQGATPIQKDWNALEEIVGSALQQLKSQVSSRRVDLDFPHDLPLARFDGPLIEQVVVNLIENATKHTPPDSPIEVVARREGGEICLEVSDHGPGLPPGMEERIFEKFFQAEPARSRRGVGLGLAICRSAMAAHGGRIWARNRPEGGAVFAFTLPLEPEGAPTIEEPPDGETAS